MCIIHLFPAGIDVNWEGIFNGATINDDGHGWAIASREGLQVGKSMDVDRAVNDLDRALSGHGKERIIMFHSRFGTHGVRGVENIHPFYTDDSGETVMSHNGILPTSFHPTLWDRRSDTAIFVSRIVPGYLTADNGVPSRRGAQALGKMIGYANKLVFLSVASGEPKARIVNASCGIQSGGAWYSNDGYKYGWGRRLVKHPAGGWTTEPLIDRWADVEPLVPGDWQPEADEPYTEDKCDSCGAIGFINRTVGLCTVCEACTECGEEPRWCDCYVTSSAKTQAAEEQKAIEAAITE